MIHFNIILTYIFQTFCSVHATCPANLILDSTILTVFSVNNANCIYYIFLNFFSTLLTSSVRVSNIFLNTLFCNILNLCGRQNVTSMLELELELEFFLRPTVSRPVRLGIGPPFGTLDQMLSCTSFFLFDNYVILLSMRPL
jgi:hypothetical protein